MSEKQWRVVADRDKGDDPSVFDAEPGDLVVYRMGEPDIALELVRIERPVPTTGLPDPMRLTDAEADSFHEAMHAPHPPTREQIAAAIHGGLADRGFDFEDDDTAHLTARVLALIQNGAGR